VARCAFVNRKGRRHSSHFQMSAALASSLPCPSSPGAATRTRLEAHPFLGHCCLWVRSILSCLQSLGLACTRNSIRLNPARYGGTTFSFPISISSPHASHRICTMAEWAGRKLAVGTRSAQMSEGALDLTGDEEGARRLRLEPPLQ
jgi:hypothetical protein